MSSSLINLEVEQLAGLLQQKTALYNQMIDSNKEFEEVKSLFLEIKDIVGHLSHLQGSQKSSILAHLQKEQTQHD